MEKIWLRKNLKALLYKCEPFLREEYRQANCGLARQLPD